MKSTSILIVFLALIVIGIIALIIYKYFMHSKEMKNHDNEEEKLPSLTPMIKYFKGQCNSFRMVSDESVRIEFCKNVFDYADKVMEFHANEELKEWWKNFINDRNQWDEMFYKKKAKQIIMMIRNTGVTPSTERIIQWNENAELHYVPYDDISDGDICDVINPCWIYQNEIFEQGLVSKKVNQ